MEISFKKLITVWAILAAATTAQAMEDGIAKLSLQEPSYDAENVNTLYHDGYRVQITPQSTERIAPSMPDATHNDIDGYYKEHKALIDQLLKTPQPLSTINQKRNQDTTALTNANVHNFSNANYVLDPDNTHAKYRVKISSPTNRLCLLFCANDKEGIINSGSVSAVDCDQLPVVPTYQTLSRVATYLRMHEFLTHRKNAELTIADTYFYKPTESLPATDTNCMVVEKFVPGKPLAGNVGQLSFKHIQDVYDALIYGGLWCFIGNLRLDENGKIILDDLEQQNRTKPVHFGQESGFYHMNPVRLDHCRACGIGDLVEILHQNPEQARMLAYMVLSDKQNLAERPGFTHIVNKIRDQYNDVKSNLDKYKIMYAEQAQKQRNPQQ